jgi:hypothetical protein
MKLTLNSVTIILNMRRISSNERLLLASNK